jgi:hypothetical protein
VNESGPRFYAWCDETDRVDAFAAALSVLACPGGFCNVSLSTLGTSEKLWRRDIHVDDVIAVTRAAFKPGSEVRASLGARWPWLATHGLILSCYGEEYDRRYPHGPLRIATTERKHVFPDCLELAIAVRSVEAEAAIASMEVQQETEDIFLGLCAPDERARVTTGACSGHGLSDWPAPVEACATYHADAKVARDLALAWVHLHDGEMVGRAAHLSLDALHPRVEAAPKGARVGVATTIERIAEHHTLDDEASRSRAERSTHAGAIRCVPRARLPGDIELTREQVLAALATPPTILFEALEAAAVPDDEWRAAEPLALELLEAIQQGAPTEEVKVTGKHTRFIERHAPYHVRRLPNGGVLLATHPYRTLWPLWADALLLLGIRT